MIPSGPQPPRRFGILRGSDRSWDSFARRDPYWAVLTEDRFRSAAMSLDDRRAFFDGGEIHVGALFAARNDLVGGALPPRRALDFGCGVGRLLPALAKRCELVVGVDVAPAMIAEARANCRRLAISNAELVCDGGDLDSVAGEFDFIHSVLVFQHLEPARGERILARLCRRLAAGGVAALHFTTGSRYSDMERRVSDLRHALAPLHWLLNLAAGRPPFEPPMRMSVYAPERLERIATAAGCRVLHRQSLDVGIHDGMLLWLRRDG
jgi:SAM-dependent methyltransferase